MKISYLLTQSLDSPSGLGRYWPLAYQMAKRHHDVEILALHPDIDTLEQKEFNTRGVHVRYVAPMHVMKMDSQKSYYSPVGLINVSLQATWRLSRAVLQSPSQIVHIGKPHPMNSLAGWVGKYLMKKNVLLDCDDYEAGSGTFSSNWQRAVISYFERTVPRSVKCVTTNTYFMKHKLLSRGVPPERIFYLPNGVERSRFLQSGAEEIINLRKKLGLGGKEVVSYIGSMSLANHAVDLLIKSFPIIKSSRPNAILILIGGGENYSDLINLAQETGFGESIYFTGRVLPEKVSLYYAISSVTVDPVYDNDAARGRSPLKLFESWACGTPFVTGDVGDRKQLIGEPPAGIITKPGDPEALAAAVVHVLSDQSLAETLTKRGRDAVEQYYWDQLVVKVESLYRTIIEYNSAA